MSKPDILHDPTIYAEPMKYLSERWFSPTEKANECFVAFTVAKALECAKAWSQFSLPIYSFSNLPI